MPWDRRIEPFLARYPALRAIGNTPLVPVSMFGDELPGVEVLAKMECLNPGGSLKDRPVLQMLLAALAMDDCSPGRPSWTAHRATRGSRTRWWVGSLATRSKSSSPTMPAPSARSGYWPTAHS